MCWFLFAGFYCTALILGTHALRSHLSLNYEYEINTLLNTKVSIAKNHGED